jgi:hypothetical protein
VYRGSDALPGDSPRELRFNIDYDPRDWSSRLIEEYDNIGAYLPCYGALLQVAVFPYGNKKTDTATKCIDFSRVKESDNLPNPYELDAVTFTATEGPSRVRPATALATHNALDLKQLMSIGVPATGRVQMNVYYSAPPPTFEAFNGDQLVVKKVASGPQDKIQTVVLEGNSIDTIKVTSPANEAYLTQVCYDVKVEKDLSLEDYPYVMAFEPDKREMYETRTDSGESLSRSLSNVNVRKGYTSTDSEEVLDQGAAFNVAGASQGPAGGSSFSFGLQPQGYTKNINSSQKDNILNTDTSRESREVASHSTTLTQMYHLFNGYHLGTNRALFFMLPRPHGVEDTEDGRLIPTFVNGPRRLEGVQEILLVINRPKGVPGICVHSLLETAHLYWQDVQQIEQPAGPSVSTDVLARFLANEWTARKASYPYYNSHDQEEYVHVIESIRWGPPGSDPASNVGASPQQSFFVSDGYREGSAHIRQPGWGVTSQNDFITLDEALGYYYQQYPDKKPQPVTQTKTQTSMVLTGRSVEGCLPVTGSSPVCESSTDQSIWKGQEWVSLEAQVSLPGNVRRATGSNQFVQNIGRILQGSLGARQRYPAATVSFLQTNLVLSKLKQHVMAMPDDDEHNRSIDELLGSQPDMLDRFREAFPDVKARKQALQIPLAALSKQLDLPDPKARNLVLLLMGFAPKAKKEDGGPITSIWLES